MRYNVKKGRSTEMSLQITSMADCFIIILVFLLKSVATGALNINPSQGLTLPQARSNETAEQALTVEISEKAVQVDNRLINPLQHFRFNPSDLATNGISTALDMEISNQKKRQELISQSNTDVKMDNKILVVADKRTPYVTIKSVLAAAAIHGYNDFKLVVAKKE